MSFVPKPCQLVHSRPVRPCPAASRKRLGGAAAEHARVPAPRTWIVAALALVLLAYRVPRRVVFVVASLGAALALEAALKHAFAREALYEGASSYSFPSGHTMAATAIAGAAAYVLPRAWLRGAAAIVGGAWAVEVGVSSVVQHNHYPSDVVGGWSAALAAVTALWLLSRTRIDG